MFENERGKEDARLRAIGSLGHLLFDWGREGRDFGRRTGKTQQTLGYRRVQKGKQGNI